jgi:CBS domain containing-hemolysin-like protein
MWWMKNKYRWMLVLFIFLIATGIAFALGNPGAGTTARTYTNIDILLLFVYVLLALIFSFLCSIAEAVLLSITPSYIAGLRESKPRLASLLKRLRQDNVDRSLAAILTLNTIAHTVGAIGSGAKATIIFGSAWFGLFSAIMTLMILFLSEIIPKTIGAVFWRNLAGATAVFVRSLIPVLYPLIMVSEWLTRLIAHRKGLNVFSREEFIAMASIGEQAGTIDREESRIIRNLFRFESLKVSDIMTPRTVISALKQDITVMEAMETASQTPFSRLPLFGKNLDDITGFILKSDLLLCKARDQDEIKLSELKREILTVGEIMSLSGLLELFLDKRQHIAVVTDNYGGTQGLVTLEDVVETLLGMEIIDEMDKVEDMQALARQQWVKRARALGVKIETAQHDSLEKEKPAT